MKKKLNCTRGTGQYYDKILLCFFDFIKKQSVYFIKKKKSTTNIKK